MAIYKKMLAQIQNNSPFLKMKICMAIVDTKEEAVYVFGERAKVDFQLGRVSDQAIEA